ncbi:hypothetical protein FXW78_22170 [Rhodococcus opacus]|nr:hypothetical protein [Rhodococcus opacus]
MPVQGRQGHQRPLPQPARLRLPPRRHRGRSRSGRNHRRRRLGRYGLRAGRRQECRVRPRSRRGTRDLRARSADQGGRGRAAQGGPPDQSRVPRHHADRIHHPAAPRRGGVLTARNAVVVSPGRIDRCPCGTGTSARLAVMHARGDIQPGERFIHESIIGTKFDSVIESTTRVGDVDAVIPSVAGQAWITDISQVGLDPTDPFPTGYTLADSWMQLTR